MLEKTQTLSDREPNAPTRWQEFLWWLATAEKELLQNCVIDRNRYAIVGMTVMSTWLFATLAWTYFFSTVTSSLIASVLLGIFMGGIILSIDRALIKGISRNNKKKAVPLLFRTLLALTIGLFMAQPALLYLFDKEIKVQVSIDNEQRKKEKRASQDSVYASAKKELTDQKAVLQSQLNNRYAEVSAARNGFISETDGTGGSRKIGLKNIAEAKQREYQQLDANYKVLESQSQPQINRIDSQLQVLEKNIQLEQANFEALLNNGFITRIEALNHLVDDNTSVAFRYYLLVAILMLIELMPVIAKTLLPDGSYDEKVRLREAVEKELTQKNHERELALKELHNQSAFEQDSQFIKDALKEADTARKQNMKESISTWKNERTSSLDETWKDLKRDMLLQQEE
jgi:phosphate/sulfate permease